jgi:hypothetical protein
VTGVQTCALPISTIYVKEVDKKFYESIPRFKKGYAAMYPSVNFAGDIAANTIVEHKSKPSKGNSLLFFSGGVDSFDSLINHHGEKPVLMTLWGSDVFFDDLVGWENVKNHVAITSKQFGVDYVLIKSNFRKFLNEGSLHSFIEPIAGDGWWHGFQHGIGIIGHAAPIAYLCNSRIAYIASSFTIKDRKTVTCASDPRIDNYVKFAGCKLRHDGFKYSRLHKVRNVCSFSERKNIDVTVRVCWESTGGKNCNNCEKCYRTALEILSEGSDPNKYGLLYDKSYSEKMKNDFLHKIRLNFFTRQYLYHIKQRLLKNKKILKEKPELKWVLEFNLKD